MTKYGEEKSEGSVLMHMPVAEELAIDILEGRWETGKAITLEDMQRRFSISRTVAREVARQLESVGAVQVKKRLGIVAQPVDLWAALNPEVVNWKLHSNQRRDQLISLTELRLAVEPAAAAGAATNAPVDVRTKIGVLAVQMRNMGESGHLEEFHQLDIEFHSLLLKYSGNELFAALADIVSTILRGRVEIGMYPQKPEPEALDAHQEVADGIVKGDAAMAREGMRRIVDEVDEAVSSSI
ncbi:FadR/GntR family transcriptional regulator [Bifidobacterium psychraerophilum]|jgi:DNA-binding FadR family transcriptional regulator|uniref:Putative transcription factor n=1 Tax=Bifidobacterium psychraerophilum TaxID=218140 RepID=A0A087CG65_9BIFI|nr:FCD domain-containing protein [Bifidobacterium psychraerophilum]KFI82265.1 putative transcription factor [Bifidobacterium psychraerophilum]MCI1660358.1 FCD domain-containing protein [Bifidobacterium psychraerophilum]MCI1804111.1 FCD domain-containing protein [Bifidobacterium psychraerophilum]MCI2176529.1 FCD domain-containing protein [Bifidobacterium psychraerophilum]MCI2182044.1 FCD domain-containing protein [Bifidobacterium psychraerophilum]